MRNICVSDLEEGNQYTFLGVLVTVRQKERLSLECTAKEFLCRMAIIWSNPLSGHKRITASNQFALPVLAYLMCTQQWPVTELKKKGSRGLRSIEEEYKLTKIKAAVKLYGNGDPAMAMVREFEERAEELGHSSLVKETARYAD